jgi:hypothetical protein
MRGCFERDAMVGDTCAGRTACHENGWLLPVLSLTPLEPNPAIALGKTSFGSISS